MYTKKHLDSIASYMKTGKTFSAESIHGRIVDAITYLTLISGMIVQTEFKDANAGKHQFFEYDPTQPQPL